MKIFKTLFNHEYKEVEKFIKSSKSLDPIDIATKELELGILPLNVRHKE